MNISWIVSPQKFYVENLTPSTSIKLVFLKTLRLKKKPGLLGKMSDSRPEAGNLQGEFRTSCCTRKQGSFQN